MPLVTSKVAYGDSQTGRVALSWLVHFWAWGFGQVASVWNRNSSACSESEAQGKAVALRSLLDVTGYRSSIFVSVTVLLL